MILVGEMRDLETISTALTAAETGHLVFGTLHTQSAPSTIDRIIDVFPAEQQEQIRIQIASSLQGVVTQALMPTADGMGRVPALEVLLPDDAVRNLIRQGKVEQIYSVMQTNTSRGMQTMEQSLADLIQRGVVKFEVGLARSSRPAAAHRRARASRVPGRASARSQQPQDEPAARRRTTRRGELVMDDQSLWKKEVSFGRKPKEQTDTGEPTSNRRAVRTPVQEGALVQRRTR